VRRAALVLLLALLAAPRAGAEETIIVVPDSEREVEGVLRGAVDAGRKRVEGYFGRPFPKPFLVEVLSSRSEMDAAFARRWKTQKAALRAGRGPKSLARAWSGRYKYGVSGSLVRFIETTRGRATIDRLLRVGTNAAAMATLGTTEGAFLSAWRKEIRKPAKH